MKMSKIIILIIAVCCIGCTYGGSTVECESLSNNDHYMCEIHATNTDVCFDVFFSNGKIENKCVDDSKSNDLFKFSTKNKTSVIDVKIVEETYSSDTIYLITMLTSFMWFMSTTLLFVYVFGGNYNKRNHYTITLIFVCLFHFIGLGILYLIDKTKEEMEDRKKS